MHITINTVNKIRIIAALLCSALLCKDFVFNFHACQSYLSMFLNIFDKYIPNYKHL